MAAGADPLSRSLTKIFDLDQLVISLLADPQGVRRRIEHASVDTCAAHSVA